MPDQVTIRQPLLVRTLLAALGQVRPTARESMPVLVGIVDTETMPEMGLYSVVDAQTFEDYGIEPGKWLQLSGTRPGVPDPSRGSPFGYDQIHPAALKPLREAAYDAYVTTNYAGAAPSGGDTGRAAIT